MDTEFSTPSKGSNHRSGPCGDSDNNNGNNCASASSSVTADITVTSAVNVSDMPSFSSSDNDDLGSFGHSYGLDKYTNDSGYDTDEESITSQKSNKTTETSASTISLPQDLTHAFAATLPDSQKDAVAVEDSSSSSTDYHEQDALLPLQSSMIGRQSSDMGYFDDFVEEPVLILGVDISHLSPRMQFVVCASGVFGFNLMYGYLQELIAVQILSRQLGLFLAMFQFTGYTCFSYLLQTYVYKKHQTTTQRKRQSSDSKPLGTNVMVAVPFLAYLGLSLLRAVDLAMTNMAMQYINYPAKTLMKSSRVVFTMIFGVFIARKKYLLMDYFVVMCMVTGLAIFMHADATSSAVFQPIGVIMLTVSLLCDGAISNMSESIMTNYGVGQDEFIFRMYSIALVAITAAAAVKGDLQVGLKWLMEPGTYDEMQQGLSAEDATWSAPGKFLVMLLFSTMGFFGSSCSAAITKHFGALTMSITSTARKATTLFLSFLLFNNVCTTEHIAGVIVFITALLAKSFRRSKDSAGRPRQRSSYKDLELQIDTNPKVGGRSPARTASGSSIISRRSLSSPCSKNGTPGRRANAFKFS